MKIKINREIKVGLMVLVSIFLFYFGINFLKGTNIFQSSVSYIGNFENLDGLVASSQVKIKGYKVGQVSKVEYDFTKKKAFKVIIEVNKNIALPIGTVMTLTDDGLMGGKMIELNYNSAQNNNGIHKQNDVLPTQIKGDMLSSITVEVMPKIERIAEQADSLMQAIRKLVENPALNTSLCAIEQTTADLATSSAQLTVMMNKQLPTVLNNISAITEDFKTTSDNIKKIDFEGTMKSADFTVKNLQSFTEKLNSNKNSLGLLMNDKDLYLNLNKTVESADKLLIDLRVNPKKYVHFSLFGGKKQ